MNTTRLQASLFTLILSLPLALAAGSAQAQSFVKSKTQNERSDKHYPSDKTSVSACQLTESSKEADTLIDFCRKINQIRSAKRLPALYLDLDLGDVAQDHAEDMYKYDYFSHTNLNGESSFDRIAEAEIPMRRAAENIAKGQKTSAKVLTAWMNSPGHRKNMLNSKYHRFGIGMVNYIWVLNLTD